MSTQATVKRMRRETRKARTIARRQDARTRAAEQARAEQAFAALLAATRQVQA